MCVNDRLLRADYPNDPFHPSSVYKLDERFSFSCYFAMQIFWQDNRYCNFIVQILSSETFKIQKSRWFAWLYSHVTYHLFKYRFPVFYETDED